MLANYSLRSFYRTRTEKRREWKTGFTLIELLIVVAIIAILAAIAVPNFLEAQVRAKVSRVKADQRTLATGVESYAIDWNRSPIGYREGQFNYPSRFGEPPVGNRGYQVWAQLTTPIAFMTSIPMDPFYNSQSKTAAGYENGYKFYNYQWFDFRLPNGKWFRRIPVSMGLEIGYDYIHANGHTWVIESNAPWGNRMEPLALIVLSNDGFPGVWPEPCDGIYDSTNGTISKGGIFRTNKGIITAGGRSGS